MAANSGHGIFLRRTRYQQAMVEMQAGRLIYTVGGGICKRLFTLGRVASSQDVVDQKHSNSCTDDCCRPCKPGAHKGASLVAEYCNKSCCTCTAHCAEASAGIT